MNSCLFLSLLLAHVIGDFYLQNDKYCAQKEESLKSASNLNGNLNCSKELEHYAS